MHVTATASAAAPIKHSLPAAGLQHRHPFATTLTTTLSATQRTVPSCCLSTAFLRVPGFDLQTHIPRSPQLQHCGTCQSWRDTTEPFCLISLLTITSALLLTCTTATPLSPARRDALIAFDSKAHTNSTRILKFARRHSRFALLDALRALLSLRAAARTLCKQPRKQPSTAQVTAWPPPRTLSPISTLPKQI